MTNKTDSAKLLIDRLTSAADLLHMTFPTPKICAAIEKDLLKPPTGSNNTPHRLSLFGRNGRT